MIKEELVRIRIKYLFVSRVTPKMEEVAIEVPRLGHLIQRLEISYGKDILRALFNPSTVMLINGKHVNYVDGFDVELKDGDEITFLHVVDGG